MHETLHAVSHSWVTSPPDMIFKPLLGKRQPYTRTGWFIIQIHSERICLAGRSYTQPSQLQTMAAHHMLPGRPRDSERRHLMSGTLEKSGLLLLVVKRKRPFRKPSIYTEEQTLTSFARLDQLLQLCMFSASLWCLYNCFSHGFLCSSQLKPIVDFPLFTYRYSVDTSEHKQQTFAAHFISSSPRRLICSS